MTGGQDAAYRLRMAEGFLEEARQDVELGRWRSAVDNGQAVALARRVIEGGRGR
ncbi:MAG: hypothetical protein GX493_01535 [Firmicutes bacterium]|nr:hypothetical protein [Bacillota bacterium]